MTLGSKVSVGVRRGDQRMPPVDLGVLAWNDPPAVANRLRQVIPSPTRGLSNREAGRSRYCCWSPLTQSRLKT